MKPLAWFAVLLCAFAANRLIRWDELLAKDCARLDAMFGANSAHRGIAESFARLSVLVDVTSAALAALLL